MRFFLTFLVTICQISNALAGTAASQLSQETKQATSSSTLKDAGPKAEISDITVPIKFINENNNCFSLDLRKTRVENETYSNGTKPKSDMHWIINTKLIFENNQLIRIRDERLDRLFSNHEGVMREGKGGSMLKTVKAPLDMLDSTKISIETDLGLGPEFNGQGYSILKIKCKDDLKCVSKRLDGYLYDKNFAESDTSNAIGLIINETCMHNAPERLTKAFSDIIRLSVGKGSSSPY